MIYEQNENRWKFMNMRNNFETIWKIDEKIDRLRSQPGTEKRFLYGGDMSYLRVLTGPQKSWHQIPAKPTFFWKIHEHQCTFIKMITRNS